MNSKCPICDIMINFSARYPNAVCSSCKNNAVDLNGNVVKFYNIDEFGGIKSVHYENGIQIERNDYICYIVGAQCRAEEGRFGGIIIQIVNNEGQ